ncbi:MAG TPA: hypothetical protein VGM88_32960 [Kofleriaceae bacterium]|jgi:hypothetical protein
MRIRVALIALALAACAHHNGDDGGDDSTTGTLTISPPTAELQILNGAAATQAYTAMLTAPDGSTSDVTSQTSFTIPDLGSFDANTLTVSAGGKSTVTGAFGSATGQAQVIARVKDVRIDPSLPTGVDGMFAGADDPSHAPNIVYPPVNTVMPRNLGDFEAHWTDGSGDDTFEISVTTEYSDIEIYVPGGNGDPNAGPEASWGELTPDEWAAVVGNESSIDLQVRGITLANPTTVGAAPPMTVPLSNETMEGGLYYWASTSTDGAAGIFRHDMSMPGTPAQEYYTTNQTAGRCVACHVLSRDGTEMAITYDGGGDTATMVDVASTTAAPSGGSWNFGTFSPDGTQFLSVEGGVIVVRSYADMMPLATMPADAPVSHPDLSPDGTKLVYVKEGSPGSDWSFDVGSIYTRSYDPTTMQFGAENPVLVADGQNNYYPSWSPDSQWVLFNKAVPGTGSGSYNNATAQLWVVKGDGTSAPIGLAAANVSQGLTNSWGRWAPFGQTFGANDEPMFWVTVSSRRDFGVRLVGTQRPQVWMTPFFPDRAAGGTDPSTAAFRLPFQDIGSNNHIAQWAEKVVVTQ